MTERARRMMALVLPAALSLVLGMGCVAGTSEPGARAARPATPDTLTEDGLPVVGHLAHRGMTVTILAGEAGPQYTVKDASGEVLVKAMPLAEMQAAYPGVYRILEEAVAAQAGDTDGFLDASLRQEQPEFPTPGRDGPAHGSTAWDSTDSP